METQDFIALVFDEMTGLYGRFRNGDYYINDEDRDAIIAWTKQLAEKASNNKSVNLEDFKVLIELLDVLEMSDKDDAFEIRQEIYFVLEKVQ